MATEPHRARPFRAGICLTARSESVLLSWAAVSPTFTGKTGPNCGLKHSVVCAAWRNDAFSLVLDSSVFLPCLCVRGYVGPFGG